MEQVKQDILGGEGDDRSADPVIEAYKKHVDRTLIRENLKLTVDQRLQNLEAMLRDGEELRRAMTQARAK